MEERGTLTMDTKMERLFRQVELVQGKGDRNRGELCLMSLVALLAGEAHTDAPATASPVIRQFAITINDAIPGHLHQRLKVFAPLIIGTNDGRDLARANLLVGAAWAELLPRICTDLRNNSVGMMRGLYAALKRKKLTALVELQQRIAILTLETFNVRDARTCTNLGLAVAQLICFCGRAAKTHAEREWYWLRAIELLDCLCNVSIEGACSKPLGRWMKPMSASVDLGRAHGNSEIAGLDHSPELIV